MVAFESNLDMKGTYHAVRYFFDKKYPIIKRKSGVWGDVSSVVLDGMPKQQSHINNVENRMVDHSIYAGAIYAIHYAIAGCTDISQKIIKQRFINGLEVYKIREIIGIYGHATCDKKIRIAACEFADCIEPSCDRFKVPKDIIPNLHVYIDDTEKPPMKVVTVSMKHEN